MAVSKAAKQKPDPCSFVIFGVSGDLAHRLVIPALYNLAVADLLPDKFCVVGIARKGMTSAQLRDSLMKGLRQFATRAVDDAIAERLLACVTCIEADPKEPESFDAMQITGTQCPTAWRPRISSSPDPSPKPMSRMTHATLSKSVWPLKAPADEYRMVSYACSQSSR